MAYSISHHQRLKPKKESTFGKVNKPLKKTVMKKKRITTDEELSYLNWSNQQSYCCFVCGTGMNIELHHVKKTSSDKKNHKRIIPLCREHHGGTILSPHGASKKFREKFPMRIQNEYADALYSDYEYQIKKGIECIIN